MFIHHIQQIAEGWTNTVIKRDWVEVIANSRLDICKGCPSFSENAKKEGYQTIRFDEHCTECGCPTLSKTRCISCSCPLNKWLAQNDSK